MAQVQVTKPETPLLKFQDNLKKTQFGINFGKAIFSPGNQSLSAKFLTEAMRQLGLPIPKGVTMTLEAAQMISSGQSAYTGYQTYKGLDNMKSVVSPSVSTINLALSILQQCGLIKAESQEVQMIKVGTDIALIICSFGTNVYAWISLAMDITAIELQNEANAKRLAYQGVSNYYQNLIRPQASAAASLFKEFQEGGISTFGFIGKLAEAAPDLWPQYFPQFQTWAPVWDAGVTVSSSSTNWYGSKSEYTAGLHWKSIRGYTPEQIKNFVFTYLIEPYLYPFLLAEKEYAGMGKLPLLQAFTLAMLGGQEWLYAERGMSDLFKKTMITPWDMESHAIQDYFSTLEKPKLASTSVVSGDISIFSKIRQAQNEKAMYTFNNRERLAACDILGRTDGLFTSPEVTKEIDRLTMYEPWQYHEGLGDWNESGRVELVGRERQISGPGGAGAVWRKVKNYFAAMAMLDQMRADNYFKGWEGGRYPEYAFFSTVADFEKYYRDLQLKMLIRRTNTMALANVALFLNTDISKLKRIGPNQYVAK